MAAKKSATAAGRKVAHRKALKNEIITQHTEKKRAIANFLTKAAKPTKKTR